MKKTKYPKKCQICQKLNNLENFSACSSVEVVHFSKNGQFFFYKVKEFGKNWTMIMMMNFSAT